MSGLIIVPARGGSKRLPAKNEMLLAGKTLLEHTSDAIRSSSLECPVLLTTDSESIASEGRRLGWNVPFLRPAELAEDTSATIDAILHALNWYREETGADPDVAIVLQPTSPLRGGQCIRDATETLDTTSHINSVVGMSALHLPAAHIYSYVDDCAVASVLPDDDRKTFVPNGTIYAARVSEIRNHKSLFAPNICPLLIKPSQAVDIDDKDGWNLAEAYLTEEIRVTAPSNSKVKTDH